MWRDKPGHPEFLGWRIEMHGNDAGLRHRRSKHYELGRHGALKAWAEELDLQEAADLLGETLAEEKRTDLLLVKLAEQRGKLRGTLPSVLLALRGSKASTSASAASEICFRNSANDRHWRRPACGAHRLAAASLFWFNPE